MDINLMEKMRCNFQRRNIEVEFYDDINELKDNILNIIPLYCSVGIGNSATLKKIGISEDLGSRGNIVYDKTKAKNQSEVTALKKKSLLSDWYILGSNAISVDGHIVNIDHSGNRVAALMYGPDNVIIVVGKNKITNTLEQAIFRTKNIASPQNAKRAGYNPPCVRLKKCIDCNSSERVCNYLVVIQGQYVSNRMKVFIVDEDLGF
ncbi:lactate utilization protein [Vallitalea okinawensis]|uniref:lactate utilization protein n=1 Tax=Vallitalea okinawensis TaxID=2078660 RepID=UPI000CFD7901|nr:lactate utilization protein [Vallitalea okinawensis]